MRENRVEPRITPDRIQELVHAAVLGFVLGHVHPMAIEVDPSLQPAIVQPITKAPHDACMDAYWAVCCCSSPARLATYALTVMFHLMLR